MLVLALVVVGFLGGTVATTPASAAVGSPFNLSPAGEDGSDPQVAVNGEGEAVFTWQLFDGTNSRIQARARSAGGALSSIQTLSAPTPSPFAKNPKVALDDGGDAVFTWTRPDGSAMSCCDRIEARARSSGGTLSAVQTLSAAGKPAGGPQVADDGGDAIFTWVRSDGSDFRVQTRERSATGALTAAQNLSPSGETAGSPGLGVDGDGDAVYTWTRSDGTDTRIQARKRSAAGTLSTVRNLSAPGQSAFSPEVGVADDGDAVFTWGRFDGSGASCCNRIQARARSASGVLSGVQNISPAGESANNPHVAVDADGDAVFTWIRPVGADVRVQARARSADGVLSAVENLSPAGQDAFRPQVAVDPSGDAVFVWQRDDGSSGFSCCSRVQTRERSATGALGEVQTLSTSGASATAPQVGVDAGSDAVFTWQRPVGADDRIQGAATLPNPPPPPAPPLPSNVFSIGKLKGKKLTLEVPGPGLIEVRDVLDNPEPANAAAKKKRKKLKPSSATATAAGSVTVKLRLTKKAKKKLKRKGKVKVKAAITFTPTGGLPNTQTAKLKVKKKK
jgi:hypothetical protein